VQPQQRTPNRSAARCGPLCAALFCAACSAVQHTPHTAQHTYTTICTRRHNHPCVPIIASVLAVHVKRNGVCCCNAVSNRGSQSGAPRAAAATVSAAVTLTRQWVVEVEEAPALQSSSEASMSPGRLAQRSIQRGVPRSMPRGQCNVAMQRGNATERRAAHCAAIVAPLQPDPLGLICWLRRGCRTLYRAALHQTIAQVMPAQCRTRRLARGGVRVPRLDGAHCSPATEARG
jgi:hypothetical protein